MTNPALPQLAEGDASSALSWADPVANGINSLLAYFGDGSDGAINFDGSTTVLGLAPSSGVYTLTRDIYLADGSQVSGTAKIATANYRIYCRGTLTIGTTANINNDGNNASTITGGVAVPSGTLQLTAAGRSGGLGSAGTAGVGVANGLGGTGGAGGASSGGPGIGGGAAAGNVTVAVGFAPRDRNTWFQGFGPLAFLTSTTIWTGGSSGASGSAAASSTGGGSGSGGGIVYIAAFELIINGTITAKGGNGGAATGAGTGAGGGAGSGGGALALCYRKKSGTGSTLVAATVCAGGTGGAPQGAGKTGAAGSVGSVWEMML